MKKNLRNALLLVGLLALFAVVPAFARDVVQDGGTTVVFTPQQQTILTVVIASAALTAWRFISELYKKQKWEIKDVYLNYMVLAISLLVAFVWYPVILPAFPDLTTADPADKFPLIGKYITQVFALIGQWWIYGKAAYDLLLKQIKNSIGAAVAPKVFTEKDK